MKKVFQEPLSVCPCDDSCESKASLKPVEQVCILAQFCSGRAESLVMAKLVIICFPFLTRRDCDNFI